MRLGLFNISRRWPRQRTQGNDRTSFSWTAEFFHSLLFNSSALYYFQTPMQRYGHASTPSQFLPISGDQDVSLPPSLKWYVWPSSSGNNCHAVHRSLSSGASLWRHSEIFFYLVSYCQPSCILQYWLQKFALILYYRHELTL